MSRILLITTLLVSASAASGDYPRKFDEIPADFAWSDVMARLDNVAIQFKQAPSDGVLYLIAYAGRKACVGQADKLNLRAKKYLVRREVDSTRVILIDGEYLERPIIDVWIVPPLVSAPKPVPNIDQKRVRVTNCRKRSPVRR